ncbi:ATP-dependent RNA helicase Ddx1 [Hondaea fermentalgiana]|uniref:ATP-dependent RNA helicase Ddx1 n=1 Tax=Hondaea fermentalgiana TaxID=2315210 RepID=A0A2R5GPV4_9STRA|nr:ATP-dependent RNA helicase Ddx1 [Hondaea fermentalgiana]|eukprot:GBG32890.1 ATP-dependent RNA helicase Ddx1 [Hondaea fermentalgiana]
MAIFDFSFVWILTYILVYALLESFLCIGDIFDIFLTTSLDLGAIATPNGVQALTQASESIEDAEKREGERAEQRRSAESSKRRSLRDAIDETLEYDQLPSELAFEEEVSNHAEDVALAVNGEDVNDGFARQRRRPSDKRYLRRRSSCYKVFNVVEAVFLHDDSSLAHCVTSFLSVRQHVGLAQVSRALLETVREVPLRLDYSKRVVDPQLLESVFGPRSRNSRATSWRVAGLYSSISDLRTLFNVIDPGDLEFIGLVNPRVRSLEPMRACTKLLRFELHGCESALSLEPLLDLAPTLRGLSLLACRQIEDVSIAEHLPELRMLSIFRSSRIKNLPEFARSSQLEFLSAGECADLASMDPIRSLNHLRVLDLSHVRSVTSLEHLRSASQLRVLILDRCVNLTSLQGLECCNALEVLRLNFISELPSLCGLEHCPNLTSLELTGLRNIEDLSPLAECEKLEDLLLLKCSKVVSLGPLRSLTRSMRRLIVSGCQRLQSEDDAGVIEACTRLIVFECAACHPGLLISLMNCTRPTILAAAERELPVLSQYDFETAALPEVKRRLSADANANDKRAALRVIQACSANNLMLSAMVREDVVEALVSSLFSAEECAEVDETCSEQSQEMDCGGDAHRAAASMRSRDYVVEALRALGALIKDTESSRRVLGVALSVEHIAGLIFVPEDLVEAREELKGDLLVPSGTLLDEEKCTAEAARVLARVLQHTPASGRSALSSRIIETNAPLVAVDMMSACSMDRTRRPLIVFLNTLLDANCVSSAMRENLAHDLLEVGLVDALLATSEFASIETQMLTVALLASVSKAGDAGVVLIKALCKRSGSFDRLVALLNSSEDREVLRSIVQVLLQTPVECTRTVAQTPKLLTSLMACMQRELHYEDHAHFSSQSEASLLLLTIQFMGVLARHHESACVMISEEASTSAGVRSARSRAAPPSRCSLPSCQIVRELHGVILNGPYVTRIACARVLVDLARASQRFKVALVDSFKHSKGLKDLFMLAAQGASSTSDVMAGLDLLLILLEEPGVADLGARFSTVQASGFTQGLVRLALMARTQDHVDAVARALALMLASRSQRLIHDGVIVSLVGKVQTMNIHIQTHMPRLLSRSRRRSSPSRMNASARNRGTERAAALRMLVALIDLGRAEDVVKTLGNLRVFDHLAASLVDDDHACRELAVRLLEVTMQICDDQSDCARGQKQSASIQKLFIQSIVRNPLLPRFPSLVLQALIELLASGSSKARVSSARVLAMAISRCEDVCHALLGSQEHLSFEQQEAHRRSRGSAGSRASLTLSGLRSLHNAGPESPQDGSDKESDDEGQISREVEEEAEDEERHCGSDGTEAREEDTEQGMGAVAHRDRKGGMCAEARPAPLVTTDNVALDEDGDNIFIALRVLLMEPCLPSRRSVSMAKDGLVEVSVAGGLTDSWEHTVEDMGRGTTWSSLSACEAAPQPLAEEVEAGCELVEALIKADASRVRLSSKDTCEPLVAALVDLEAFSALAIYLCSSALAADTRLRGYKALAAFVHGRSDRLLVLDEHAPLLKSIVDKVLVGDVDLYASFVDLLGSLRNPDEADFIELCARFAEAGLADGLKRWQTRLAEGGASRARCRAEVDLGRALLVPALHGSTAVLDADSIADLEDLVSGLFASDERLELRIAYGRLLGTLDPGFLDDASEVFGGTVAQGQTFRDLSMQERLYEAEQLRSYHVVFQRVRGFPVVFSHEEIFSIRVQEWTTFAIQSPVGRVGRNHTLLTLSHRRVYYEVELLDEFDPETLVGWVSNLFQSGVILGYTAGGVSEDPESWGLRLGDLFSPKDVLGVAADLDAQMLVFTRNGKTFGHTIKLPGGIDAVFPAVTTSDLHAFFNFGSRPFRFSAPSRGYRSVFRSVNV